MIPGVEYEVVDGVETGRARRAQFRRTMRYEAVPPSKRESVPFEPIASETGSEGHG